MPSLVAVSPPPGLPQPSLQLSDILPRTDAPAAAEPAAAAGEPRASSDVWVRPVCAETLGLARPTCNELRVTVFAARGHNYIRP